MSIIAQLGVDIVKLWNTYASVYLTGMWKTVSLAVICTLVGCLIGFLCGVLQTIPVAKKDNALKKGLPNLEAHIENMKQFGVPVVVALNRFVDDTDAELEIVETAVKKLGARLSLAEVWAKGGDGALDLADQVVDMIEHEKCDYHTLYDLDMPLKDKINTIATKVYGADGVDFEPKAAKMLKDLEAMGYGKMPVCMAKTQMSLSDDATVKGRPKGFKVTVREIRLSAGAGFVVAICGAIMTMPGLPKSPAAERIDVDDDGKIVGLF